MLFKLAKVLLAIYIQLFKLISTQTCTKPGILDLKTNTHYNVKIFD
jgi:hypothetical protein